MEVRLTARVSRRTGWRTPATLPGMSGDQVTVTFSRDQAFVLSHWLYEVMGSKDFDRIVDRDPTVWSAIYVLDGMLKSDPLIFSPDYSARLEAARGRLREILGEEFVAMRLAGDEGESGRA